MSAGGRWPAGRDGADGPDVVAVARDDILLLLGAWREDVGAGLGPVRLPVDPVRPAAVPPVRVGGGTGERARRPVRRPRRSTVWAVAAAVAAFVAGGATVAAAYSGPGDPLWPVTNVVYPDRAESRQAEADALAAIAGARAALAAGDRTLAARLLDEAADAAARVRPPERSRQLLAEVDRVRALLADSEVGGAPTGPTPGSGGATPTPDPDGGGSGDDGTGGGDPDGDGSGDDGSGGQPLPLPSVPLPPLPLPTLPVPSLPLPTLPLG